MHFVRTYSFLVIVIAGCLVLTGSGARAQSLLVEYRFNETGSLVNNTGTAPAANLVMRSGNAGGPAADLHGANGGGVSGFSGDRAFDNTASTAMGTGTGGGAYGGDVGAVDNLQAFTLLGWFNAESPIGDIARLFEKLDASGDGFVLWGRSGNLELSLRKDGQANAQSATSPVGSYADVGSWVFFGVTYDGLDTVRFYRGTQTLDTSLLGSVPFGAPFGALGDSAGNLYVGNAHGGNRPFDGLLDNLRIYGGALSGEQLELLRAADVVNVPTPDVAAIPEPSSLLLLGAGVGLAVVRRRRQREAEIRVGGAPRSYA